MSMLASIGLTVVLRGIGLVGCDGSLGFLSRAKCRDFPIGKIIKDD